MTQISQPAPAQDVLRWALHNFGNRLAIGTSFQREGVVIVDMAARIDPEVRVFTLDTGRLPPATHNMIEIVRKRYGISVEVVMPDEGEIEEMVTRFGPNLFYESPEFRNLCCHFRKVRPHARKLESLDAWVVGLRREQSDTRDSLNQIEEVDGKLKVSPLIDWSRQQVLEYLAEHEVPEHPLYSEGYTSIGCEPCTRATRPGETERAGRWWWEQGIDKECGLHFTPEGRVERTVDVLVREILKA